MPFHNLSRFFRIHFNISYFLFARLHHLDNGLILAETDTSGLGYDNFAGQSLLLNQIGEVVSTGLAPLAMPQVAIPTTTRVAPVPLSRKLTWFCILSRIAFNSSRLFIDFPPFCMDA